MCDSLKNSKISPSSLHINITRPVYTEKSFTKQFTKAKKKETSRSLCGKITGSIDKIIPRLRCNIQTVSNCFPIIKWLPNYSLKNDILADFTGGLTVGIMHIPQGLAFAMLASLPPVTGLYTALVPVFVYMLMGTSRYLSQGSFAVICLMVAQVCEREVLKIEGLGPSVSSVQNMTNSSPTLLPDGMMWSPFDAKKIKIAVSLALLIGFMQVAMGILRFGFIATYLSDPLISGFTTGCAVLVVPSQLKHILGLNVPQFTGVLFSVRMAVHMLKNIASSNLGSIITGSLSLFVLIGLKTFNEKFKSKLPFPVIAGTAISYAGEINSNFGVQILEKIPKGIPPISIPSISLMQNMITDAFVISIVIFATNISLSKMFAKKNGQTIDANQELIAYGACNIGISFFSGFAICNALARTVVQENLAHTQLCSIVVIGLILLVLLFIAHLFFHLPKAILAAIIIANLIGLLRQFSRLKDLWKICRNDAIVWFATCFGVILLGIDMGLGCGVLCAVLMVVLPSSSPKYSILGHVPGTDIFKDINAYPHP
ncbi:sulfate transporter-like [Actinia tenebrosa]|uniref:Sulfate transporter-like n=1 Tax=Actinia tenebrosa TaxID=6105 RepID=A0A6P8H126_ACTTE|nr:sulfate transporter-like [Actinia tenebrosa]